MHSISQKRQFISNILSPFTNTIFRFNKKGPFVLVYHSVYAEDEKHLVADNWSISKNEFEKHLKFISKYFLPISIASLADSIKKKEALDPKWVAITFDDGFNNVINNSVPLLKKYNIPWTFCIPSLCVEEKQIPWQTELSIIDRLIRDIELKKKVIKIVELFTKQKIDKLNLTNFMLKSFVTKKVKVADRYKLILNIKKVIPKHLINPYFEFYKMVTWDQLNKLKDENNTQVNFAIHGGFHVPFDKNMTSNEIDSEVSKSISIFRERLGPCNMFSCVGGLINRKALELIEKTGYGVCLASGTSNDINFGKNLVKIPRMIGEYSKNQLSVNMLLNNHPIQKNNKVECS